MFSHALRICRFLPVALAAASLGRADVITYSTGAAISVNLGCTMKNGHKDQLIWATAAVRDVRSGRIPLKYLHTMGSSTLAFRNGVGGQSMVVGRLLADPGSWLTVTGQGLFDATAVGGGGNISAGGSNVQLRLGAGAMGLVDATSGLVFMNGTQPQGLIVGQYVAGRFGAVAANVLAGGTLQATASTISNLTVSGKLSLLTVSLVRTEKLTVTGGVLEVKNGRATTPPAGTAILLIDNTSATGVTPAFTNVAEGAIITAVAVKPAVNALSLKISYVGGTGNDMIGTVQP